MKLFKLKEARKSFISSLSYYSMNSDPVQKLCELEFLKGSYKKALYLSRVKFKDTGDFWGLTHEIGKSLFSFYVNLQIGDFVRSREIANRIRIRENHKNIMKALVEIFEGNYRKSLDILSLYLDKSYSCFTIEEFRLFFSRSALLNYILFHIKFDKNREKLFDLAKFYLNDLYLNSFGKKDLVALSHLYFSFEKGDRKTSLELAKAYFEKLQKESKIDFERKLWFFYDSFIYGDLMEKAGNIKEALRGYKNCVKANPYTDLAKRALLKIKYLKKKK